MGRTGTYIAVDILMRLLNCSNDHLLTMKLDIMGIVHQLRRDRTKMVQTKVCRFHLNTIFIEHFFLKEQYMLINRCVGSYLKETGRLDLSKH